MVAPATLKKLTKELLTLQQTPPDGVRVTLDESDILNFTSWIQGPPGTPYSRGFFRISFDFDNLDFPNVPPTCKFVTKIFHPNVSRAGDICVSTLKKDWKPEYGIARILVTIKCLLIAPNPDSALNPEASRLLQEDYEQYAETAALWTSIHASKCPSAVFTSASESIDVVKVTPSAATMTNTASKPLQHSCSQNALPTSHSSLPSTTSSIPIQPVKPAQITLIPAKRSISTAPKRGLRRL